MLASQLIALITTQTSRASIHAALPLLSEKICSISPQIIFPVYKTIKPFRWFLIGQLVLRRVKMLGRTNQLTDVEGIAHVIIPSTGLGTVATARTVTVGTHTSNTVAKVFNFTFTYLQQFFREKKKKNDFYIDRKKNCGL